MDGIEIADDIARRMYREINRFGLLLSVVGGGIVLYYGAYVVAGVFALSAAFFVYVLRKSPLQQSGSELDHGI